MKTTQIEWRNAHQVIGRWTHTESHAGQLTYSLTKELDNHFVLVQFMVDLEDEVVRDGWYEDIDGEQHAVPLTPEERAEAEVMIEEMRSED